MLTSPHTKYDISFLIITRTPEKTQRYYGRGRKGMIQKPIEVANEIEEESGEEAYEIGRKRTFAFRKGHSYGS